MRHSLRIIKVLTLVGLCICSCQYRKSFEETRFPMDTYVRIKIWGSVEDTLKKSLNAAFEEIERVESLTSHFNQKSILSAVNLKHQVISQELAELAAQTLNISRLTDGAFDPTVYPLLELWGFYDTIRNRIPSDNEIEEVLNDINWKSVSILADTIRIDGVKLDLSGIAKGYAVDRAAEILKTQGVKRALLDAGGDILCMGEKSGGWNIGIKHPREEGLLGVINLAEGAVATSGDYENFFMLDGIRYHHLMDPKTGKPARRVISATVIAPTTQEADAWATALFVMGKNGIDLLDGIEGLEGLIILEDISIIMTKDFPEIEAGE